MEPPSRSTRFEFLSDLPESISHKILSLLDIKHVARVSTLSRICRKNCLSSPFLTIDLGEVSGQEFYRFSLFLHRFMYSRNGVGVHQFKLKMYGRKLGGGDEFHIGNWILEATKCNVEKIVLHMLGLKVFNLPSGVLNSASLRDLEVWMGRGLLNLPTTSFGGLENLKLRNLQVTIKFDEWISRCKSLKVLCLVEIIGIEELYISSSSLEELILSYTDTRFDNVKIKVSAERLKYLRLGSDKPLQLLKLHAPKLEQFIWGGLVSHYSCEGNLESLCHSDIYIDFHNEHRVRVNGIIGKVLQSMYRVSSIVIHDYSIKEISRQGLLPEFCNLRSLTLKRNHYLDGKFQSTIFLLNSMPHLNTLKIEGFRYSKNDENEENNCYKAEYWESQNLKFVHSLKEFEMEINGEQNEIELIKYLLKNAEALKRMTIHYSSKLPYRQSEISRKIQEFQIASSSITMSFFHHHGSKCLVFLISV